MDLEEEKGPDEEDEDLRETEEPDETNVTEKRNTLDKLDSELAERIDEAIRQCEVQRHGDVDPSLFMLACAVRSIEEELDVRCSLDIAAEVIRRWKHHNQGYLDHDHDYLTEFVDKLSLVRFPKGQALLRALDIARGLEPPKKTRQLSSDVQLLAKLCRVLQQEARYGLFFLDGRSAAKALGRPHETVASWLRALASPRLGIIKRMISGHRGMATRYKYIAAD